MVFGCEDGRLPELLLLLLLEPLELLLWAGSASRLFMLKGAGDAFG